MIFIYMQLSQFSAHMPEELLGNLKLRKFVA
jgi:hypothetical protein